LLEEARFFIGWQICLQRLKNNSENEELCSREDEYSQQAIKKKLTPEINDCDY
ncbi:hypothetical protein Csa_021947, partial [Cucumis sativus]